jgi:Fic family protein
MTPQSIIYPPKDVSVSGDVSALLQQVDENAERLNERRPFDNRTELEVRKAFLPDRVTATLNIEGIAATRRQTLAIMDAMVVTQNSAKEDQDILNALRADEFVYDQYEAGADLDAGMIREVNRLLLDQVRDDAGVFRKVSVEISGASFHPPEPSDIDALIREITEGTKEADFLHPIVQAAWVHHQVSYVHPFIDGNGRTARLLQDFILLKRNLYPIGVPSAQRDAYYQALHRADGGDWDDIVSLLAQNQLQTLGKIDAITRAPAERQKWIAALTSVASQKKTGALHKQYAVWKSRMEQIRDAFCRTATEIDDASDVIGVSFRWYETMEFDDWKALVTSGRRPPFTWSVSLLFFMDGEPVYKLIGFFSKHRESSDDFALELRDVVSMRFTGLPARSEDKPDFVNFSDPDVRLRELLYHEDKLHSFFDVGGERVCIDDKSVDDVVRETFEDVFYRKGGLAG